MMIKMRFAGQGIDKTTGSVVKWNKGDVVSGEFDDLLPDTFSTQIDAQSVIHPKPRPITRKSRGKR